jgi:hypothetical protein
MVRIKQDDTVERQPQLRIQETTRFNLFNFSKLIPKTAPFYNLGRHIKNHFTDSHDHSQRKSNKMEQ